MRTEDLIVSACRHCHHYQSEGRRGGQCQQLGVPVHGGWRSCSLAIAPFPATWENVRDVVMWKQHSLPLPELPQSNCAVPHDLVVDVAKVTATRLSTTSRSAMARGKLDE